MHCGSYEYSRKRVQESYLLRPASRQCAHAIFLGGISRQCAVPGTSPEDSTSGAALFLGRGEHKMEN